MVRSGSPAPLAVSAFLADLGRDFGPVSALAGCVEVFGTSLIAQRQASSTKAMGRAAGASVVLLGDGRIWGTNRCRGQEDGQCLAGITACPAYSAVVPGTWMPWPRVSQAALSIGLGATGILGAPGVTPVPSPALTCAINPRMWTKPLLLVQPLQEGTNTCVLVPQPHKTGGNMASSHPHFITPFTPVLSVLVLGEELGAITTWGNRSMRQCLRR